MFSRLITTVILCETGLWWKKSLLSTNHPSLKVCWWVLVHFGGFLVWSCVSLWYILSSEVDLIMGFCALTLFLWQLRCFIFHPCTYHCWRFFKKPWSFQWALEMYQVGLLHNGTGPGIQPSLAGWAPILLGAITSSTVEISDVASTHWQRDHRLQPISAVYYWVVQMGGEGGLWQQQQQHSSQTLTKSLVMGRWNPIFKSPVMSHNTARAGWLQKKVLPLKRLNFFP